MINSAYCEQQDRLICKNKYDIFLYRALSVKARW